MNQFHDAVCRDFGFLCSDYGFRRTTTASEAIRFESDKVFFTVTANARDGICVDFGRIGQPGAVPEQSTECLSLGTFLAAIRTYQGMFRSEGLTLPDLAAGLKELGQGLIAADAQLYSRVRELRFWHTGEWITRWGTTIELSPAAIQYHRQLVPDIMRLIHDKAA